jgi:translation initiation factor 2B subunit (eIF-2B alpha/beta/delta family)
VAAEGIDVWNPVFDVTPASLIDGIVTECVRLSLALVAACPNPDCWCGQF